MSEPRIKVSKSEAEEEVLAAQAGGGGVSTDPAQQAGGSSTDPAQQTTEHDVAVRRLSGRFTKRVVTLADIAVYREAPKELRFALLQQSRYRAAKAGISSAPLWSYTLSIIALLVAFLVAIFGRTPVDKSGGQILPAFDMLVGFPIMGGIVVLVAILFTRLEAEWASCAKTWQSAFEDEEKNLPANHTGDTFFEAWPEAIS